MLNRRFAPGPGEPHAHEESQFIHARQGVIHVMTARGQWTVPPQRALWMPAGESHAVSSRWGYELNTVYLGASADPLPAQPAVVEVSALLEELIRTVAARDAEPPSPARQQRLVDVLWDELPLAYGAQGDGRFHLPEPVDSRLRRITAQWRADPADARGLAALADLAHLTPRSLTRSFVRETGLTPGAWRTQQRLLAALEMLGNSRSVTEVALAVGYGDVSSFIAVFRRAFGTTPAQWRR